MKIWNSNLRFNMENPVYREAYDNLHEMDRKKYKSCNHVIAVAVNEYFKRQKQTERDPYFEAREREEKFIAEIVEEVGKAVREAMPGFMATYIMEKSWATTSVSQAIESNSALSDNADSYDDIDFSFAGE